MDLNWKDNRIIFSDNAGNAGHGLNEIWKPQVMVVGTNKGLRKDFESIWVGKDVDNFTNIDYYFSADLTITCPTSYARFPFDVHSCNVLFYETDLENKSLQFIQPVIGAVWESKPTKPRDYQIEIIQLNETEKILHWGEVTYGEIHYYSVIGFKIKFTRLSKMYILTYYLPSLLFVIISWISFFIPPTAYPARFGLLITTILVLVNTFNNVVSNTPNDTHNITDLVFWMLGCIFFVFCALVSYALVITRLRVIEHVKRNNDYYVR